MTFLAASPTGKCIRHTLNLPLSWPPNSPLLLSRPFNPTFRWAPSQFDLLSTVMDSLPCHPYLLTFPLFWSKLFPFIPSLWSSSPYTPSDSFLHTFRLSIICQPFLVAGYNLCLLSTVPVPFVTFSLSSQNGLRIFPPLSFSYSWQTSML